MLFFVEELSTSAGTMTDLPIEHLSQMSAEETRIFWRQFEAEISQNDETAADETLAMGLPVYTAEQDTPANHVIRTWPDGRRELVLIGDDGSKVVVNAAA
jgi:hypothetical protein